MEPPSHIRLTYHVGDLTPGFCGRRIDFSHRRYEDRTPEARAEYDRLRDDLRRNDMRNPLITYRGRVIVGMRRFEIMRELGATRLPAIEIVEDVSEWWKDGLEKLEALKALYYR